MSSSAPKKYADQLVDWLKELGYTHCFFVAGGNNMHLLDSVRTRMTCVPFVHEVGAAIAVEYFNAARDEESGRAFALVTAGPGITNAITGIAGAFQESRELLVLGGQVKTSDLARGAVRQRGIQEIDGIALVESIAKQAILLDKPLSRAEVTAAVLDGQTDRQGPVFLELPLDIQAHAIIDDPGPTVAEPVVLPTASDEQIAAVLKLISGSARPAILIGGGVARNTIRALHDASVRAGIPLLTSWNGTDRVATEHPMYAGRPDTWGQRRANLIMQQADVLIAVGARLSLQQTGFAWEQFVPSGQVVQVEIDAAEITKGHPHVEVGIHGDANDFLRRLYAALPDGSANWAEWHGFLAELKELVPFVDPANLDSTGEGFVDPYAVVTALGDLLGPDDVLLPCSSGNAATASMQALRLRANQKLVGDKSLASMGYGLCGAIGAALSNPGRRVVLTEGDGGFAQNLQELGTLAATDAPVKVLLMANDGYASIRMTQRNYFNGAWIGCDVKTGLGIPDWEFIAKAYGIEYARMDPKTGLASVRELMDSPRPAFIEVPIDPEQTYFPKIASAIQPDGTMKSNPLHLMDPQLDDELKKRVLRYIPGFAG